MMDFNYGDRIRQQAQERLRGLTEMAAQCLGATELDALSLTIAAYFDRADCELARMIDDQLAIERVKPLTLARLH